MKYSFALTLATAGSIAAAAQHQHGHRHHHKREVVTVDGPTVVEYMLDNELISADKVCQGITDGTLAWANGQPASDPCQTSTSTTASSTTTEAYTPTIAPAKFIETEASSSSSTSTSTSTSTSVSVASSTTSQAAATSSAASSSTATGLDASFPDGELDCSTFPSDYGAVSLDYLGLDGWSGIQYVTLVDEVISSIVTAVTGDSCTSGAMCSYACPPGYQKSQWPTTQGSTGQSVGGLQCKGGKLYLTNSDLSDKLCIPGVGGVQAKNTLSDHVAVCRTDYPGTESETIPISLNSGETKDVTCPNGETYYKWEGKVTSAQYYVNPAGTTTEEGCQWGDGSKAIGNWAPINLGVGENNGKWLSIFQNSPTTTEKLDFNIKIQGDNLSGSCKYEDGSFVSDTGSNDSGCTVEVMSGDATFVFY
ncbi:SUN family protein UTH1 [Aspergillus mulundensis]|uniref:SUN protein n=1 Tax=Aspergillus mulundensis TaxID=1810919 RepID=A0A3D8SBK5_9EURO|nr:SUN protein [Aspergillus mulundensis]RDW83739.1 SUN protein [Aspergillus mulundensis]